MYDLNENKPLLPHSPNAKSYKHDVQIRYVVIAMCTICVLLAFGLRNVFSIAITVMVRRREESQNVTNSPIDKNLQIHIEEENMSGEFDWDAETQQMILSAFYYGFCVMPLPGGWLADTFGAKRVLTIVMLATFVSNACIPAMARTNVWLLVATRVLDGASQAMLYPGLYAIVEIWIPPNEISLAISSLYAGSCVGIVVSSYVAGFLCSMKLNGGWPLPFYVFSCIGLIFCLFWMWFPLGDPDQHPWMSDKEKKLFQSLTKAAGNRSVKPSLSWSGMLSSLSFWALSISFSALQFGYYFSHSNVPMFLSTILEFDVKMTCLLVSLAYMAQMVVFIGSGIVADRLISRQTLSVLSTRKLMTTLLFMLSAGLYTVMCYVDSYIVETLCIMGALVAYGFAGSGLDTNFIDIGPRHVGTLSGIILSIANVTGFLGPTILGILLKKENSIKQWHIMFGILASSHIFGLLVFLVFGVATQQEWDMGKSPRVQKRQFLKKRQMGLREIKSNY